MITKGGWYDQQDKHKLSINKLKDIVLKLNIEKVYLAKPK